MTFILSAESKLKEWLIAGRLLAYLTSMGLKLSLQSAYNANHSTKTALLRAQTDILQALDRVDLASLAMLDMLAAFDFIEPATLFRRLEVTHDIRDLVLNRSLHI
jgi:hypothetical protein